MFSYLQSVWLWITLMTENLSKGLLRRKARDIGRDIAPYYIGMIESLIFLMLLRV